MHYHHHHHIIRAGMLPRRGERSYRRRRRAATVTATVDRAGNVAAGCVGRADPTAHAGGATHQGRRTTQRRQPTRAPGSRQLVRRRDHEHNRRCMMAAATIRAPDRRVSRHQPGQRHGQLHMRARSKIRDRRQPRTRLRRPRRPCRMRRHACTPTIPPRATALARSSGRICRSVGPCVYYIHTGARFNSYID